jgi:polyisoprenyl-phosphate glycosyltransferase
MAAPVVSIVVPVFDEQECLPEFHRQTVDVLNGCPLSSEIVYVDDGSRDGSAAVLEKLATADERVRVVTFSRNFGHQMAVSAGLDFSRGQAVVVIDSDLQDPPELIPDLIERWESGADVVHAVREERQGESWFKTKSAALFYALIRRLTDLDLQADAGDFRLYDRRVVDALCAMPERFRFIRGMTAWVGFDQASVGYARHGRHAGASKYPLRKMIALAATAITSFSFVPLQLASVFGFIVALLAVVAVPIVIPLRLAGVEGLGNQTTVLITLLFFGGVQLVFLGLIGEYLGRIAIEIKQRPLYIVRSVMPPYPHDEPDHASR